MPPGALAHDDEATDGPRRLLNDQRAQIATGSPMVSERLPLSGEASGHDSDKLSQVSLLLRRTSSGRRLRVALSVPPL
jgi:hypothetical protein